MLSGPLDDHTSNYIFRSSSRWIEGSSLFSITTRCYIFLRKKRSTNLKNNNNLRKEIVETQHTMNFWARLSISCCTPFPTVIISYVCFYKNFVGLGSRPIIVACKRKMLLDKDVYIKQQLKKKCNNKKIIIVPSASHVKRTKWIRQCA